MVNRLRSRGVSAAVGLFMLAVGTGANAQSAPVLNVSAAVKSVEAEAAAKPLGSPVQTAAGTLVHSAVATTTAIATTAGTILQSQPAQSVTVNLAPSIATEAAWLYRNGWPLYALVDHYSTSAALDQETTCLATAVYFEARGESLDGQLAVARVVMNRAASGRYASDWCGVVKQPAQFSFVHHGQFPYIDTSSSAWSKAQAIARLAVANVVPSVGSDVLWYHADYVAPAWRRSLQEVEQIGAHIFYRA